MKMNNMKPKVLSIEYRGETISVGDPIETNEVFEEKFSHINEPHIIGYCEGFPFYNGSLLIQINNVALHLNEIKKSPAVTGDKCSVCKKTCWDHFTICYPCWMKQLEKEKIIASKIQGPKELRRKK